MVSRALVGAMAIGIFCSLLGGSFIVKLSRLFDL